MRRSARRPASLAALLLLLTAAINVHATEVARVQGIVNDDRFPDFTLQRANGSELTLSAHDGPQVVVFFATWCPYCRKLMPALEDLQITHGDDGLRVVGVNFRDDGDTTAYARRLGIHFDIVVEGDDLARQVGVLGTPTTFILDERRRVLRRTSKSDPGNPQLHAAILEAMDS